MHSHSMYYESWLINIRREGLFEVERGPREVTMQFYFNICPKRAVLGIFIMFDLLPFFPLPKLPHNHSNIWPRKKGKKSLKKKGILFAMVPWYLQRDYFFCLSQRKTRWNVTMDKVGLKTNLLEISYSMILSYTFFFFFYRCQPRWSRGTSSTTNHIL